MYGFEFEKHGGKLGLAVGFDLGFLRMKGGGLGRFSSLLFERWGLSPFPSPWCFELFGVL